MQILVVVAIIQLRPLKTEVEEGSITTAIGYGLAGPKPQVRTTGLAPQGATAKGKQVNIPAPLGGVLNDGNVFVSGEAASGAGGGLSFLHNVPTGRGVRFSLRYDSRAAEEHGTLCRVR